MPLEAVPGIAISGAGSLNGRARLVVFSVRHVLGCIGMERSLLICRAAIGANRGMRQNAEASLCHNDWAVVLFGNIRLPHRVLTCSESFLWLQPERAGFPWPDHLLTWMQYSIFGCVQD